MKDSVDREYYERRLIEERERAQRAVDAATAAVHREFAAAYQDLLGEGALLRVESTLAAAA